SNTGIFFSGPNNTYLGFTSGGTQELAINGTNIGIGTNSPTGSLEIEGGNVGIGTWTTPDGGSNNTIHWGNVGIGTTKVGGTGEAALTVMNGNVGIGTWVPGQMLDVKGTVRTTNFTMSGQNPISGDVLTASDS